LRNPNLEPVAASNVLGSAHGPSGVVGDQSVSAGQDGKRGKGLEPSNAVG
jgi:hypothetical protein